VGAEAGTVADEVMAVLQPIDLLLEQAFRPLLALDQRQMSQAFTIQEQQVEHEQHKLVRVALVHRRLTAAEGRHPSGLSAQSSASMQADFTFKLCSAAMVRR
jgi:hypothetical protein